MALHKIIIIKKMKFLKRNLSKKNMLKAATAHLYGLLYYASSVWLLYVTKSFFAISFNYLPL